MNIGFQDFGKVMEKGSLIKLFHTRSIYLTVGLAINYICNIPLIHDCLKDKNHFFPEGRIKKSTAPYLPKTHFIRQINP